MFTDRDSAGGIVVGIGVDLMHKSRIYEPYLRQGDPFLQATYSEKEQAEAAARHNTYAYYAGRFCGKEAVFKTLGISGVHVVFNEIEILNDENGTPSVTLHGALRKIAEEKGIRELLISLTSDGEYAEAFAIAQT